MTLLKERGRSDDNDARAFLLSNTAEERVELLWDRRRLKRRSDLKCDAISVCVLAITRRSLSRHAQAMEGDARKVTIDCSAILMVHNFQTKLPINGTIQHPDLAGARGYAERAAHFSASKVAKATL